jgi:nucleotidyltransferase substrate binding protein (TIGR01987 family)
MAKNDYSSLSKAISSLEDILQQPMDPYRRDGAIQRFEYTFELTWKSLQRSLKTQGLETGSPKQVFRAAHKAAMIDRVDDWFEFLEMKNLIAHTYNESLADRVFDAAKRFPPYARQALVGLTLNED